MVETRPSLCNQQVVEVVLEVNVRTLEENSLAAVPDTKRFAEGAVAEINLLQICTGAGDIGFAVTVPEDIRINVVRFVPDRSLPRIIIIRVGGL
jgi:hypothetical protein